MKNFRKSLSALLVTAAIAAGVALPATAAGSDYEPEPGTDDITFYKYLEMDAGASVPGVTFEFELTAGDAVAQTTASSGKLPVYAGNDAARVGKADSTDTRTVDEIIADAVGTATFAPTDSTTSGTVTKTEDATTKLVTITTTTDEDSKYAYKEVGIDLSDLTYNEPGVYRYILTEVNPGKASITYDNTVKTLDVYVFDASTTTEKKLEITGCVMYNGEQTEAPDNSGTADALDTKDNAFINSYLSYDLTVSKKVTGNQGSRDEYFEFTVVLSGVTAGNVYTIDLNNADETFTANGNSAAGTNPKSVTTTSGDTITATLWLQSGQSFTIKGIDKGVAYTVTENIDTAKKEGYSVRAEVTGDTTDVTNSAESTGVVSDTGLNADTTVAFTNNKEGVIPTGVLMSMTPVIIIGVVVIAGVVFFAVRNAKRKALEVAGTDADDDSEE
ncbi:pilin isopeptide linkage domain-containing protein [Ruminococcaceae bacterium YRB3002]|nr:pilin isopeptide linkage domain-containing protein [Ruminococcaceae bacterium YRB3002]